jgi:cbb3-type cytochrome oxidase maturation protein
VDAIYWLIPLTLLILLAAIIILFWAINNDQFLDLDKEASQILFDNDPMVPEPEPEKAKNYKTDKKDDV